jgi:hypothetical protein
MREPDNPTGPPTHRVEYTSGMVRDYWLTDPDSVAFFERGKTLMIDDKGHSQETLAIWKLIFFNDGAKE